MTKLRSAGELFNEFKADVMDCGYDLMDEEEFIQALSAHDSDIRKVIEEKIDIRKNHKDNELWEYSKQKGYLKALTEILEILKENK